MDAKQGRDTFYTLDAEMEQRAHILHKNAFIFDAAISMLGFDKEEKTEIQAFLDGGVTGGNMGLSTSETDFSLAIENISNFKQLIDRNPETLKFCTSVNDFKICKQERKFGMVIHFQNTTPILDRLDYLYTFYDLGLRVLQLTYNTQTFVGAGCCERVDGGLTNFGLEVVAESNRLGLLIDISHCGHTTSWDAINFSKAPVSATHAGVYSLAHSFGRNKPDNLLKAIAETGGVLGIPTQPCFVKRNPETHEVLQATIDDVIDQIDYAVNLMGIDHVGFGSDMSNYAARTLECPRDSNIRLVREKRPDVFGVGPTDKYDPFPIGIDSHAKMLNLTRGLLKRGYSDEDTKKILGDNWLRVFEEVWRI